MGLPLEGIKVIDFTGVQAGPACTQLLAWFGGGGLGAFEIAARYSAVDLNSNVIPGVSQTKTGGVYGGRQQIGAADLSWYPNDWLRFMLQFQYITVDKLNSAATTQIGQQIKTLALRAQAAW